MNKRHIHIPGICGTFMGGLAQLAKAAGYSVSGCDHNVYPPMSDQLSAAGIELMAGFDPEHLRRCNDGRGPDMVVIGNALSRGNPVVETVLNEGLPYTSGPQWLSEHVLHQRWVLAVAGTHGKTTASSMLAWLLESAGLKPGFLIGGVPANFGVSARLGEAPFFVVEADEYDTAFFDKRSKFVHYRPRTLILNNLEFDHADIFPDLAAIQRQFHHLLRTVPGEGRVIVNGADRNLAEVLDMGCWTPWESFGVDGIEPAPDWTITADLSGDDVAVGIDGASYAGRLPMGGEHNRLNALAAVAAARHAGVTPGQAIDALESFQGVKRRMEVLGQVRGVTVYDDFAHHPTAIATTLQGLRRRTEGRIIAVLEPRSNTMRLGVHNRQLPAALSAADRAWIYQPEGGGHLEHVADRRVRVCDSLDQIIEDIRAEARDGDHIVVMSNGDFGGLHAKLLSSLSEAGKAS